MALPKRRHSHSRTRLRRSHDALVKPQFGVCPECGEPKMPHLLCANCGKYRQRHRGEHRVKQIVYFQEEQ